MAKEVSFEKIIWLFLIFFNFLAFVTFFEFNSFIVPMIWVDMWVIGFMKLEAVFKTLITVMVAKGNNRGKKA